MNLRLLSTSLVILASPVTAAAQAQIGESDADSFMASIGRQATLDFSFEPSTDLDAGGSFSFWDARLSAPLYGAKLSEDWTLGLRMRYRVSTFDWDRQAIFDNDSLHRIDFSASLIYLPDNSPWMGFLSAGPALATDGSNIDGDDFFFVALAGVGYKFSETFTLLGGAYFSQDFGEPRLLPAPGFVWTPNDEWTLSLIPPRLRIAYAPNRDWRIAAEAFPDGGRWSITTQAGQDAFIDRGGARLGLRVERRVLDNGWMYVGGGWMVARDLQVETTAGTPVFNSDADAGAWFGAGFAWRF